ncbi:hypothetical protein IMG5_057380 [Ichthyophthirius multifiliis]|uniref:Poly [ADP-ribose] polymerase n=1 Tax=Ichthyophthirius multifiliis TaxID=5932 RepID=G0QNE0_ICHMU|nr:hypothetical protein IMG5_057380 [Ichthyophthirius multifiliis]EGR33273.1 hypothetical protein IMG5_057380 [Ichthyophthirius multifiliis]|eukprot:XP_004037259.1 hypothetical protein IMG5_057380 [Ichthyophthirius multifiliis]
MSQRVTRSRIKPSEDKDQEKNDKKKAQSQQPDKKTVKKQQKQAHADKKNEETKKDLQTNDKKSTKNSNNNQEDLKKPIRGRKPQKDTDNQKDNKNQTNISQNRQDDLKKVNNNNTSNGKAKKGRGTSKKDIIDSQTKQQKKDQNENDKTNGNNQTNGKQQPDTNNKGDKKQEDESKNIIKKVITGVAPLDEYCLNKNLQVYYDKQKVYDAKLNQSNVTANNNKFYVIQLLKDKATPSSFYVFNRWGRVGVPGQNCLKGPFSEEQAKNEYETKLREKTIKGDYRVLDMDYGNDIQDEKQKEDKMDKDAVNSTLPLPLKNLIQLIFDMKMMNNQMKEIGYDCKKMPLGKLSKDNISKAYNMLKELYTEVEKKKPNAFELQKEGEDERFTKDLHNRMLLWHGSRLTNYVGIISQGLRIAPPEAPVTGYMFGKGVYFADMVSKSANYCFTNKQNNIGLMLLCDVACGNFNDKLQADYYASNLPPGKHSTRGLGKTAPLEGSYIDHEGCKIPIGEGQDQKDQGKQYSLLYNDYLESEGMEKTLAFKQQQLKALLPIQNADKIFDLKLDWGKYSIDYNRNGTHLLLGGSKGHLAVFDWRQKKLNCEIQVKETVNDVKFLHDERMFAVAQKRYKYRMKNRDPQCLKLNPYNAISCVGDNRGCVSMYSPNTSEPLVKMLCHKGTVNAISFDRRGYNMVTAGTDGQWKVWDLRTYKVLHEYFAPNTPSKLDISQSGILALSYGSRVHLWKDWHIQKQKQPYIKHEAFSYNTVTDLQFIPYEDFLGIGINGGYQSIVVPAAGEANFDAFEANPYQTKKQAREATVQRLLEKIPSTTISLNPNKIGTVDTASKQVIDAEEKAEREAKEKNQIKKKKNKMRGKNKTGKVEAKKQFEKQQDKREQLKEQINIKMRVKNAEKEKKVKELDVLNKLDNFGEFDPMYAIRKQRKTQ